MKKTSITTFLTVSSIVFNQILNGGNIPKRSGTGGWTRTSTRASASVYALLVQGSTLYAAPYDGKSTVDSSTNSGDAWVSSTSLSCPVLGLSVRGQDFVAGTPAFGQWHSTNAGISWNEIQNLPIASYWTSVQYVQGKFYATATAGLSASTDGATWSIVLPNDYPTTPRLPTGIADDGTNIYTCAQQGVFRSTDHGSSWQLSNSGLTDTNLSRVTSNGSEVFVGSNAGLVFRSTDLGATWSNISAALPRSSMITALWAVNGHLFVGTRNGEIFLTRNDGNTWILDTTSLGGGYVNAFTCNSTYLFAGIVGGLGGVWRCSLTALTEVQTPDMPRHPAEYSLSQNYPNPFNPSTEIRFSLPARGHISLKVFDMLGREVATLADDVMESGEHSITWNAGNAPSGIYFCRFAANNSVQTKKMILLK